MHKPPKPICRFRKKNSAQLSDAIAEEIKNIKDEGRRNEGRQKMHSNYLTPEMKPCSRAVVSI